MNLPRRPVASRLLCLAVLGLACVAPAARPAAPAPEPAAAAGQGEDAAARNNGETRLRKLHLVRPDLIPYPIAYDVYC